MQKIQSSVLALLTVCFLASSLTLSAQKTETRTLSSFKSINLSGGFDAVKIREGNQESITITASGIDLDKIVTEVKNNGLDVHIKNGWYGKAKINIEITYRAIEAVNNSGSSDIVAETTIRGEKFEFNSSGSGDFKGEFDVRKLSIAISGSSDMSLVGKADKQNIAISGSGDVDASKLKGEEASVAISGSGDVQLNVSGRVKTAVSGSGDVTNNNK